MGIIPHGIRDQLELAAKAIAVTGPTLTAVKVVSGYARDQSLERRRLKTIEEIDTCLKRLKSVAEEHNNLLQLDEYKNQLQANLVTCEATLVRIRDEQLLVQRRRTEDPRGVKKWLVLYKPEGLDGWISQSIFYIFAISVVFMIALMVSALFLRDQTAWILIPGAALYAAIALYFWSVSLRIKRVRNAQRRGELGSVNRDLGWFSRTFLIFGGTQTLQSLHGFCIGYF